MPTLTSTAAQVSIKALWKGWQAFQGRHREALQEIGDVFGDPKVLAKYYVFPDSQRLNPENWEEDSLASRVPIFDRIGAFLQEPTIHQGGDNQLFVLAGAGMGKTSLLMILRLMHLNSLFPQDIRMRLLKLGANSLEQIQSLKGKSQTVLLLDSLDEDPLAWGEGCPNRLGDILRETMMFRQVIITCRTHFFPVM